MDTEKAEKVLESIFKYKHSKKVLDTLHKMVYDFIK